MYYANVNYCCLQLPVHTHDKNMFYRPIKIQSFDDQTSKFICPLWDVLAPLHKHLKQRFRALCVWSFENQNK